MIQRIYFQNREIVAREVTRPTSDTIGREAIDAAVALGYSVECEGLLCGDPSAPRAQADDPRLTD